MPSNPERLHATPHLERLLRALGQRLRLLLVLRGLGTLVAVLGGWVAFMFFADYVLRVPPAVRGIHSVVLVLLALWLLWRVLLRPLREVPGSEGLALLLERRHPELKQLLISAVQFQRAGATDHGAGAEALVRHVLREADERARALAAAEVTRTREPRDRVLLGLFAAVTLVALGAWRPELGRIFLDHALFGATPWPRRTTLTLELPGLASNARLSEEGGHRRLLLARGSDLALAVHAEGLVPERVTLHLGTDEELELDQATGRTFRTVLNSLDRSLVLWATGGDDAEGTERLEVRVLQPPDLGGLALEVTPPAYTGLGPTLVFDQDVEVPAGSRVRVHVLALAGGAVGEDAAPDSLSGQARLLPSDERLELLPCPFPPRPDDEEGSEGAPLGRGFCFDVSPTEAISFRVELSDATGLSNPDPGLHWIRVRRDRAPELSVIAPARSEISLVVGGAVPLRVRAKDDYGLDEVRWSVSRADATSDEQPPVAEGRFDLLPLGEDGAAPPDAGAPPRLALASRRLEVSELGSEEASVEVDQRFLLRFRATDHHQPEPGVGQSPELRARVVAPEELLRRMQERLARARLDALELSDLQREKRNRVEELITALDSDDAPGVDAESVSLAAALSGQRRVLGDAEALARTLAATAEEILYARLDENAGALLDRYDALCAGQAEIAFQSGPWKTVTSELAEGKLPTGGFAANLTSLVGRSLDLSDGPIAAAAGALDAAERALGPTERLEALMRASEQQSEALDALENLLDELSEWDNFQSVLLLTRDLLNRQKALRERTQRFASEK